MISFLLLFVVDRMFASRTLASNTPGAYRFTAVKFKNIRETAQDTDRRVPEPEEQADPKQGLLCASLSAVFCPILGVIALFYAIRAARAHNQGFFAEATTFYKKSIRWSLITFILGLTIGTIVALIFFVKGVVSI